MKNYISLLFALLLLTPTIHQAQCLTTGSLPLNFNNADDYYSWSTGLYKPSHVGSAGEQTSLSLTLLRAGAPADVLSNIQIYMRHSDLSAYEIPAGFPGFDGFTLVFDGDLPLGSAGKITLSLTGNFIYDGLRNLEILFVRNARDAYNQDITFLRGPEAPGGPSIAKERSGSSWASISGNSNATRRPYVLLINDMDCQTPWGEGGPLPVTLMSFGARQDAEGRIIVAWETSSETNAAQFELARSFDGRTFEKIGTVAAKGDSDVSNTYRYHDDRVPDFNARVYYRLKMVDQDETFTYSTLVVLQLLKTQPEVVTTLYPNPANGEPVFITSKETPRESAEVDLYDLTGKLVKQKIAIGVDGRVAIDSSHLPPGIYHLIVRTGKSRTTHRLIIN